MMNLALFGVGWHTYSLSRQRPVCEREISLAGMDNLERGMSPLAASDAMGGAGVSSSVHTAEVDAAGMELADVALCQSALAVDNFYAVDSTAAQRMHTSKAAPCRKYVRRFGPTVCSV